MPDSAHSDTGGPQAARLVAWYDRHRRHLPWRAPAGARPDPYHVWLSEVMLQQTTVAAVGPYFRRFLERWPGIEALAAAPLDDVLHAWQGLGYYSRARNLHACARRIVAEHGGRFPEDEAALRRLPGIGAYTAAAIAAIAFDRPATVVDGNVERVMARLHAVEAPLPGAKRDLAAFARALTPTARPGDYAQAVMDLGATVCTPRRPACHRCPWQGDCRAYGSGAPEAWPKRTPKSARPVRHGVAFWLERADGAVLLRRRPEKGLLGGMMEIPSTPWRGDGWATAETLRFAPVAADWQRLPGTVHHVFTHFALEMQILAARTDGGTGMEGVWSPINALGDHALPSLMKKVIAHALRARLVLAG